LLQLFAGLLLLIAGAEWLVRGAVRLAAALKVRPLVVGLGVVALGSSAPQLAVSLQATFVGTPDIAVGSLVGSNIFSLLVTLGLSALIIPLRVSRQLLRLDIPLLIGASALVFGLAWNEQLGRLEGGILLLGLVGYLGVLWRQSRHPGRVATPQGTAPWLKCLGMMLGGLLLLVAGSHWLLEAALELATDFGLSDRVIGLTIVAVGTSLPELATSLVAALRGHREIAVGNVIGSNLFNLLGVLGLTAVLAPAPLSVSPNALDFDLPVMLGVTLRVPRHAGRGAGATRAVRSLWPACGDLHHGHATGGETGRTNAVLRAAGAGGSGALGHRARLASTALNDATYPWRFLNIQATASTPSHTGINSTEMRMPGVMYMITRIAARNARHTQLVIG